jgi:hypothetical protein
MSDFVLYRTEEGVREHGRLHYQQDCITDSCFNKVDPEEPGTEAACPSPCPHAAREVHYHCRMVSSIVHHTEGEEGNNYSVRAPSDLGPMSWNRQASTCYTRRRKSMKGKLDGHSDCVS